MLDKDHQALIVVHLSREIALNWLQSYKIILEKPLIK